MYNEVDRMILDNFVECPYCGSKDTECKSFTTTIAGAGIYTDLDGHEHEHDSNHISAYYKCNNGHEFPIRPFNSCWCGWKQSEQQWCCNISVTDKDRPSFFSRIKTGLGLD